MAIVQTDIEFHYSTTTGTSGYTISGTPAGSLGKNAGWGVIPSGTVHNLFDVVTGDEASAGDTEYRCFFVVNKHATLTWQAVKTWFVASGAGGANTEFGIDTTATTVSNYDGTQALTIATEQDAPAGVTFYPDSSGNQWAKSTTSGIIGDIPATYCKAVWLKRTVAAGVSAMNNDYIQIRVEGDSAA